MLTCRRRWRQNMPPEQGLPDQAPWARGNGYGFGIRPDFSGAGGAENLKALTHNGGGRADFVVPQAAATNENVFYTRQGRARSLAEVYANFSRKFEGESAVAQVNPPENVRDASATQANDDEKALAVARPKVTQPGAIPGASAPFLTTYLLSALESPLEAERTNAERRRRRSGLTKNTPFPARLKALQQSLFKQGNALWISFWPRPLFVWQVPLWGRLSDWRARRWVAPSLILPGPWCWPHSAVSLPPGRLWTRLPMTTGLPDLDASPFSPALATRTRRLQAPLPGRHTGSSRGGDATAPKRSARPIRLHRRAARGRAASASAPAVANGSPPGPATQQSSRLSPWERHRLSGGHTRGI